MNREQKAAVIEEVASQIKEAQAIFAVDYRGLTVRQAADLRGRLIEIDANLRVVKNTLTERAADQVGAEVLKQYLEGPTAFTFVNGDPVLAAKALAGFRREAQLPEFKGGWMDGKELSIEDIEALSRLPSLDVMHGQLVGMIAQPLTGLARSLNAILSGIAIALGQIQEQGLVSGEAPAEEADATPADAAEAPADAAPDEAPASADSADGGDAPSDAAPASADSADGGDAPSDEAPASADSADGGDAPSDAAPASADSADGGDAPSDGGDEEAAPEADAPDAPADDAAVDSEAAEEIPNQPMPAPGQQADADAADDKTSNEEGDN